MVVTLRVFFDLIKLRIVLLVVATAFAGFLLAGGAAGAFPPTALGVFLTTAGACACNMVLEKRTDALMERTRKRPIPSGALDVKAATRLGAVLTVAGLLFLFGVSWLPGSFGLLAWVLYVLVYTPLKPVTTLNTLVGAVPGALPPLMGWTASGASLSAFAWILFWIMFAWQIPHFLALAWLYRDDYRRGGMRMLPSEDLSGDVVARQTILYSVALIPLTLAPALFVRGFSPVIFGGTILSLVFVGLAVRFARRQERKTAAGLFGFSLIYLPAVFAFFFLAR